MIRVLALVALAAAGCAGTREALSNTMLDPNVHGAVRGIIDFYSGAIPIPGIATIGMALYNFVATALKPAPQ